MCCRDQKTLEVLLSPLWGVVEQFYAAGFWNIHELQATRIHFAPTVPQKPYKDNQYAATEHGPVETGNTWPNKQEC
ncbi:hypothetical protein N7456_002438 [Penicillium angulare]|uniref:Uncharacterized protein n=1 Tax=Penicillium angulare TaxID=116970 RepID=A0A9W9G832_9EURO|nr:hypothetical protein N7456_002438 [Penicillium angulare]